MTWRTFVRGGVRLAGALVLGLGLTGSQGCLVSEEGDTLEQLRRRGWARVGYANEAPFAYMDSSRRRLTGEAPEIARVILERMGISRVEGVLTEFGTLIPGLKAHRFDLIAAGMYIRPLRCRQIAFSNPTYAIGEAFVVRSGNPLALHAYEDVRERPQARLGVVVGAVERDHARRIGIPDERILLFPDAPSALEGVRAGRIDAYAGTSLTVGDLLARWDGDGLERATPFRDPVIDGETARGYGAFGFRKADRVFVEEFNRHLAGFIGSGDHLRLVRPFGFTEATLPGTVTASDLCQESR